MASKKELLEQLEAARSMIDYLQAVLCKDGHEYVKVGERTSNCGSFIDVEPVYQCTRCLKRKVGFSSWLMEGPMAEGRRGGRCAAGVPRAAPAKAAGAGGPAPGGTAGGAAPGRGPAEYKS